MRSLRSRVLSRSPSVAGLAALFVVTLAGCAALVDARSRRELITAPSPEPTAAPTSSPPAPTAQPEPSAAAPEPTLRASGRVRCSREFSHSNVLLARVAGRELTGCDLWLYLDAATRRGEPRPDRARALEALVAEELLAHEARAQGSERDPLVRRGVREALAAAVERDETRASLQGHDAGSDAAVQRYYEAHRDEFTFSERVHLRAAVFARESDARSAITALRAGLTTFDAVVRERSVAREAERDNGDLGLIPAAGNDRVSAAVSAAGFALANVGDVSDAPVRTTVSVTVRVGRRGRTRTRTEERFFVLQLLGRLPTRVAPLSEVTELLRARLRFRAYQEARTAAREGLRTSLRAGPDGAVRVDERALRTVRLAPAAATTR